MRMRRLAAILLCAVLTAGAVGLPAGKLVRVFLGQTISSGTARSGSAWEGTLASDLVENGKVLAVMSNPLLRRKLTLDVMQQHIFHMAVGQIEDPRNEKQKLPVFHIKVDTYAAMTGRSSRQGSLYQQLKMAEAVEASVFSG